MSHTFDVSRREFMKIGGMAAGGAMASAGCLRLNGLKPAETKDEKGEWKHTACAMCLMCPLQAKVKKGKIVDVRGEDILPWDGKVCAKAYGGIWGRVYASDRILHPLKRVGKRGEGKFVRCSWEEVIDAVSAKIKEYTDDGHPERFETWWGCPVQTDNMYFLHYFARITGTAISYMHGQICFGDHSAEKAISFGGNHVGPLMLGAADYMNTKYAVIAAQNFPGTAFAPGTVFGSAAFYQLFLKAKERGFQYTTVDPKLGDSAAMADDWLPVKPGSDAAFALGVAHVLIKERLFDEEFLLKFTNAPQLIRTDNGVPMKDGKGRYLVWDAGTRKAVPQDKAGKGAGATLGLGGTFSVDGVACKTAFQLFAEEAAKFPPDRAAKVCEIPFTGARIEEIARRLGKNRPAVLFYPGFTTGRYSNWFQVLRTYSAVNMLLGNFEKPGGWYFPKHGFSGGTGWPEPPEVPEYPRPDLKVVSAPWGNKMSIEALDKAPCYTSPKEFHPATQALPWEHFDAIKDGRVRALFSTAENSAITQVDTSLVYDC
ncbi:MAG: molybdopterin-dependent oxidoreductase, partial [Deltaproteobacteria bacterium]|nr:molybdopterin-dependent oxidoreductase [Deltaproteobacteria bacterium]